MHKYNGPVLHQGYSKTCVAMSIVHAINFHKEDDFYQEKDAYAIYKYATEIDEFPQTYPAFDRGTSLQATCNSAERLGFMKDSLIYKPSASTYEQIKKNIAIGPVVVATLWYKSCFFPDKDHFINPQNSPDAGGHCYIVLGINEEQNYVEILSSWGKLWGNNGRCYMRLNHFKELLKYNSEQAVVIV